MHLQTQSNKTMSEEKEEEQTNHENEKPNLEIPDHRKYRESLDFTITKVSI